MLFNTLDIDCDYGSDDGSYIDYSERHYLCPHCGYKGNGYTVLQKSPPEFLLQPSPMYPMKQRIFDYWAEILQTHFPNHRKVAKLEHEFYPNTHVIRTKLGIRWLSLRGKIRIQIEVMLAHVEKFLHIKLLPDHFQDFRKKALQEPPADIRTTDVIKIYVSYSHFPEDSNLVFKLVDYLKSHLNKMLKTMERHGDGQEWETYRSAVTIWCNSIVTTGAGWLDEFEEGEFRSSGLILMLISPHYLESTSCRHQWQQADERSKTGTVKIIPIMLRPIDLNPLADFNFLPINAVPVSGWPQLEEAFNVILESILTAVPDATKKKWVDHPLR